jgi:hypothetical protein
MLVFVIVIMVMAMGLTDVGSVCIDDRLTLLGWYL